MILLQFVDEDRIAAPIIAAPMSRNLIYLPGLRVLHSDVCLLVAEKTSLGLFDLRQCACVGVEVFQSLKLGACVHAKVVAGPFRKPPAM